MYNGKGKNYNVCVWRLLSTVSGDIQYVDVASCCLWEKTEKVSSLHWKVGVFCQVNDRRPQCPDHLETKCCIFPVHGQI